MLIQNNTDPKSVSRITEEAPDWLTRALVPLWFVMLFLFYFVVLGERDRNFMAGADQRAVKKPPVKIERMP